MLFHPLICPLSILPGPRRKARADRKRGRASRGHLSGAEADDMEEDAEELPTAGGRAASRRAGLRSSAPPEAEEADAGGPSGRWKGCKSQHEIGLRGIAECTRAGLN